MRVTFALPTDRTVTWALLFVMPALVAGIHAGCSAQTKAVDGRDKPGHDDCLTPAAAAVHQDGVAGHEIAGVRAHEQHQLADLLRLAEAPHRNVVEETLHQFGRRLRRVLEGRADRSGRDGEATDALARELA